MNSASILNEFEQQRKLVEVHKANARKLKEDVENFRRELKLLENNMVLNRLALNSIAEPLISTPEIIPLRKDDQFLLAS
jgi:hypothetical protein